MSAQIYPIGEQDFGEIIRLGQVYIDKTQYIPHLLERKFYFLSRPRRFGKSLFLSTLEEFFRGHRPLFKGLAIDSYEWSWEEYPVIKISFAQGAFSKEHGIQDRIDGILSRVEKLYDIKGKGLTVPSRFESIIVQLYEKFGKGVVILIDEYEKPLLDTYGEDIFHSNRIDLAEFYSVFKDNTDKIRMLFITGVTRFGRLNIFSGLNNLKDISLSDKYSAICGITQRELEDNLLPGVERLARNLNCGNDEALQLLKDHYDGYHFSANSVDIYNPWSLLSCLDESRMTAEWSTSGTSTYLLNILKKRNFNLDKLLGTTVREQDLSGLDADMLNPVTLLYQSGYLTIKSSNPRAGTYTIEIPNYEVRTSLLLSIIPFYLGTEAKLDQESLARILNYLESGEVKKQRSGELQDKRVKLRLN